MLAFLAMALVLTSLSPSSLASTGYHHRCKVWKNKCEQHKLHCQDDRPSQHLLDSCCQPLQLGNGTDFSNNSGIYSIKTGPFSSTQGWCDMAQGGGGWMVIMRRSSSVLDFNKVLSEYEAGFGSLDGDFWFSLRSLVALTSLREYELRVDLFDRATDVNCSEHAHYSSFKVSGFNYVLELGQYNGSSNIYDCLSQFNHEPFHAKHTLKEKEPPNFKCRDYYTSSPGWGGWWFTDNCLAGTVPGTVLTRPFKELNWYSKEGISDYNRRRSFEKYELKIRPKGCSTS